MNIGGWKVPADCLYDRAIACARLKNFMPSPKSGSDHHRFGVIVRRCEELIIFQVNSLASAQCLQSLAWVNGELEAAYFSAFPFAAYGFEFLFDSLVNFAV